MLQSVITAKSQTTLPKGVRNALGVGPGDRLEYVIERDRAIIMKREAEQQDPVINEFLAFLERDMLKHPDRVREFPPDLVERGRSLVGGVDIDLDAPIKGDVAI